MFCGHRQWAVSPKPPGQGHARHPTVKTKTPGYDRGWCWLLGKLKAAGVMPDPVGGGVRVKGFNAQPFQTVPQFAGVLGGDDHAAGHDPYF